MTGAETHRPGRRGRVMISQNEQPTQIEDVGARAGRTTWQADQPTAVEGPPDQQSVPDHCHDFSLKIDGVVKYRAKLATEARFFCIAGIWRPATGSWPASYAALTTEAYPDLAPYKDRHVAVVREEDWIAWLTQARPRVDMLRPYPAGSFEIVGPRKGMPRPPPAPPVTRDLFELR